MRKFIPLRGGKESMNTTKEKQKGFTIIEVVLVLAIAGLIFLVVFLALPALQRSQRDNQRRSDVGRAVAAIQSYQSNMNGKLPVGTNNAINDTFIGSYLTTGGSSFTDPSGGDYRFTNVNVTGSSDPSNVTALVDRSTVTDAATNDNNGYLVSVKGVTCNGTSKTNALSIVARMESGGYYCANN